MELKEIIASINAVQISDQAAIRQLKHPEDDEPYQVWIIQTDHDRYILKEAKEYEAETYQKILSVLKEDSVPSLYQTIVADGKTYLLMEYIEGTDLCKCNRSRLIAALNALISLQRKTWENQTFADYGYSFEKALWSRQNRGKYLNDPILEETYNKFLKIYQSVPCTLCHDDLLPFNIIASENRAVLIDWEYGGILPYPTSFARLIAYTEDTANAFFYMTDEDKNFAIDYYYDNLLKEKGITYAEWRHTLEYFLFHEYCEWVFVGNRHGATDSEFYKKYLPIAKQQALKLNSMDR